MREVYKGLFGDLEEMMGDLRSQNERDLQKRRPELLLVLVLVVLAFVGVAVIEILKQILR